MNPGDRVVLDACVLIPMPLADTLLRMAEAPAFYSPLWSQSIMDEVTRNLIAKWDMAPNKARRREEMLRRYFPEAWVAGYEPRIETMTNDPGDRHVLAAAVRSRADSIVTFNGRHFPAESVEPLGIEVAVPSTFLRDLHDLDSELFVVKLREQAEAIGMPLPRLVSDLSVNVPGFARYFAESANLPHIK